MADFMENNVMEATENMAAVEPDTTVDTEPMDDTMDSPGTGILKKIVIGAIATGVGALTAWGIKKVRKPKKYIEVDRSNGTINAPVIGRRPGKK